MAAPKVAKVGSPDPFLQRAVEYWLDTANELGYQPLFCALLNTQGHVIKYSLRNTSLEQGKDVVSVSSIGAPHAFQLKGGDINLKRWRDEVKPEIEELIDCPIKHPEIDKSTPHVSYLVTNGIIDDSVRVLITDMNESKWKATPLHIWTRGDLLSGFQKMAEGILPGDARTYKNLIELIFADGSGFPEADKVCSFLHQILKVEDTNRSKEQRRRDIAASMLYATMIAGPYRKLGNYSAVVHIMTLLIASILHVVDTHNLADKYWLESYEIIWSDILATSASLESEVLGGGFVSALTSPFDSDLIEFRKHVGISTVYTLKLSQLMLDDAGWKSLTQREFASQFGVPLLPWGEAALLPYLFMAIILKKLPKGINAATSILEGATLQILGNNGRHAKEKPGLIPPHFDIGFAVRLRYGMLDQEFEDSYKGSSYYLNSVIEVLARMDKRETVAKYWQETSFVHYEVFIPDTPRDYYLWHCIRGENRTVVPKKEKSWKELRGEAESRTGAVLPVSIRRFPEFLPFLLLAFPHRANPETLGFLDLATVLKE